MSPSLGYPQVTMCSVRFAPSSLPPLVPKRNTYRSSPIPAHDISIQLVTEYATSLKLYAPHLHRQIHALVPIVLQSSRPSYYLTHLEYATFLTWYFLDYAYQSGTPTECQRITTLLLSYWRVPLTLEALVRLADHLLALRDHALAAA